MKRRMKEQQKVADDSYLLMQWRKWHADQLAEALAGPHGAVLNELFRMFANLKHVQPAQLIGFARSINWSVIDYDTRLTVVHEFNVAVAAIREKYGMAPIDDGLPGEPETPFRTIKAIVLTPSPHNEGAHRGEARPE